MINDVVTALNQISEPPDDEEAYAKWLETRDALQFLRQNCHETEFVAYATNDTSFIHSVLVPTSLVSPPDYNDISQWHCDPTSCLGN